MKLNTGRAFILDVLEIKMANDPKKQPEWVTQGKTIRQLIKELQTFENQDIEVQISLDQGESHKPISIVGKYGDYCLLVNSEI